MRFRPTPRPPFRKCSLLGPRCTPSVRRSTAALLLLLAFPACGTVPGEADAADAASGGDAPDGIEALDAPPFDPAALPQGDPPVRSPLRAIVVSVIDGDTFNVRLADGSEERVRFLSIDAPEMYPRGADPECDAMEAHRSVEELTPRSPVWLTFDRSPSTATAAAGHVFAGIGPSPACRTGSICGWCGTATRARTSPRQCDLPQRSKARNPTPWQPAADCGRHVHQPSVGRENGDSWECSRS